VIKFLALFRRRFWCKAAAGAPQPLDFAGVTPQTDGQPSQIAGAESGDVWYCRTLDGDVQNVRLELHQERVGRAPTVDAQ